MDFGDALLLPGAVDVHVHTRSYADEGIERCTRGRGRGRSDDDRRHALRRRRADRLRSRRSRPRSRDVEREAHVDVALWATVPPRGPIDEVGALVDAGAAAFKLSTFETHPQRFPRIPDGQLLARVRGDRRAPADSPACTPRTTRSCAPGSRPSGRPASGGDPLAHARSRPPVAEHEAIARVLELARATGVRLHICHVSTPRGVELVAAARRDGVDVSAETCPHYLLLDETELVRRGGEAKINPPLRAAAAAGRWTRPDLLRPRRLARRSASTAPTSSRSPRARPGSS